MKKTIAIVLCGVVTLSTVACSSDKEGDSNTNTNVDAEESSKHAKKESGYYYECYETD